MGIQEQWQLLILVWGFDQQLRSGISYWHYAFFKKISKVWLLGWDEYNPIWRVTQLKFFIWSFPYGFFQTSLVLGITPSTPCPVVPSHLSLQVFQLWWCRLIGHSEEAEAEDHEQGYHHKIFTGKCHKRLHCHLDWWLDTCLVVIDSAKDYRTNL